MDKIWTKSLIPSLEICDFKTSLVFIKSSRPARATKGDTISKTKTKKQNRQKYKVGGWRDCSVVKSTY